MYTAQTWLIAKGVTCLCSHCGPRYKKIKSAAAALLKVTYRRDGAKL